MLHLCDAHKLKATHFCTRCRLQLCTAGECLTNHIGHPLGPPSDSNLAFTNEARATLTESSAQGRAIRQRRTDMKQLKKEVKKSATEQQAAVSSSIARAIEELQARERELLESIKSEAEAALDEIEEELDHIESSEDNLATLSMSIRTLSEESGLISKKHWMTLSELKESMQSSKIESPRPPLSLQVSRYDPSAIQQPLSDLCSSLFQLKPSISLLASRVSSPAPLDPIMIEVAPMPSISSQPSPVLEKAHPFEPVMAVEDEIPPQPSRFVEVAPPLIPQAAPLAPVESLVSSMSYYRSPALVSVKPVEDEELPIRNLPESPAPEVPSFPENPFNQDEMPLPSRSPSPPPAASSSAPAADSSSSAPELPPADDPESDDDDSTMKLYDGTVLGWSPEHQWQVWNAGDSLSNARIPSFLAELSSHPVVCSAQLPSHPSSTFIAWKNGEVGIVDLQTRRKLHSFTLPPFPDSIQGVHALVVNDPETPTSVAFVVIELDTRTMTAYAKNGSVIMKHSFAAFITSFTACKGHVIVATADGFIRRQELFGKLVVQTWQAHQKPITSIICVPGPPSADDPTEPSNFLISTAYDSTVVAWSMLTAKLVWMISVTGNLSTLCAPDSWRLGASHAAAKQDTSSVFSEVNVDGSITIRDVWQGTALYSLPATGMRVSCICMDNDYLLFTRGAQDPRILVWNWRNSHPAILALEGHTQAVYWMKLYQTPLYKGSSQLHCLSHGGDALVEWNVTTNKQTSAHPSGKKPMYSLWTSSI